MANAPLQPQLPWPALGFSQHASWLRARGHRTANAPAKAHLGPRASYSRAAWHPIRICACGYHAMQPNTAQRHARGATRTGIPGDPWVCSPRGGRGVPARAWLGLISAAMEVNSHLHPRAHVHANADITDMRMPGRECSALELNPPRALLLARQQCDGFARAQPRKRRAAHAKTQRRPELPAELRLRVHVRATAPPKQTDHSFNHDCTVLASMYSCYHECIHVSYRRRA